MKDYLIVIERASAMNGMKDYLIIRNSAVISVNEGLFNYDDISKKKGT